MGVSRKRKHFREMSAADYEGMPQGVRRRYLISATYNSGGSRRYLIDEINSGLEGEMLVRYVGQLFMESVAGASKVNMKAGDGEDERKMVAVAGSISDVCVDVLKG